MKSVEDKLTIGFIVMAIAILGIMFLCLNIEARVDKLEDKIEKLEE